MKPNPEMVILAREFRGLTQAQVADASGMTQARIARAEAGVGIELSDEEIDRLAAVLAFPRAFLFLQESRYPYGSSAVYTRTRQMTAAERHSVSSMVNVLRIQIKRMLDHVDVQGTRTIPKIGADEFQSPAGAAIALRSAWKLPKGPIRNLTKLLEGAGIIVVECDFGMAPMDATSIHVGDMPPVIFVNKNVPGDRLRFTLAHELAHLVMHDIPRPTMEDEADEFASEFLVPSEEIAPDFSRMKSANLEAFLSLKAYWGVSIAALIMKAQSLRKIDANQKKWLYIQMAKLSIRKNEPGPIPKERPTLHPMMVSHFRDTLRFNDEEFAKAIVFLPDRLKELYASPSALEKPQLRVVR
jgi:Zn-dependent peptidase ImmA (M78 family)/transcriptional regulator with XRE-family HTH domain